MRMRSISFASDGRLGRLGIDPLGRGRRTRSRGSRTTVLNVFKGSRVPAAMGIASSPCSKAVGAVS